ncbi:hypothetical protein D1B33_03565 [Lysinibacillus yapensis]|uniref:YviE n=1 Tax=Ureibacillus yapensis TaxID=2304605 RepID=A0A396SEI8_9BACL|nr:DUF6470 family protein [Lysinibacillus yapensis]RHW39936.1 hypothetical protein D1B33_03565 [Lysinibacillus yapensis]
MDIPKLQLQTTRGQIGLTIQQPQQLIQQPKAELDLQQPQAKMTINTTQSLLSIDTTEARADLDLKSSRRRTVEVADYSIQEALNGLARVSQEGDNLMKIENGGNPIVEHAKRRGRQPYTSINIKFIPSQGNVKIDFQPAEVEINVEPQKVINNTKINKPIHQYTPGKVSVDLIQQPSLKIDWLI